eukprot:COSAG06_NODE_12637_length_1349_cov_4.700000_2_plen_153_part_00
MIKSHTTFHYIDYNIIYIIHYIDSRFYVWVSCCCCCVSRACLGIRNSPLSCVCLLFCFGFSSSQELNRCENALFLEPFSMQEIDYSTKTGSGQARRERSGNKKMAFSFCFVKCRWVNRQRMQKKKFDSGDADCNMTQVTTATTITLFICLYV